MAGTGGGRRPGQVTVSVREVGLLAGGSYRGGSVSHGAGLTPLRVWCHGTSVSDRSIVSRPTLSVSRPNPYYNRYWCRYVPMFSDTTGIGRVPPS